ncbi:lipoyltransferase 1, mitochondrial [Aplysia californica]|uniref:Lipoyltransferase 1, mitochondrial n=1 Tax=Aplysia californica TaxID=6500 RepID=A0ABM0JWL0_APLCA|nr:lipoyltransferase 1, mitochondrial [Aplysia californica]
MALRTPASLQLWKQSLTYNYTLRGVRAVCFRGFSTSSKMKNDKSLSGRNYHVLVSTSNCIFENLALEEWLYSNAALSTNDYLLLWQNKPAVVLGRHQNPWLEANVPQAREENVDVARRASGGGTVYHDMGNLNLSFLTSRDRYNRKKNLQLVVSALSLCGDANLTINERDDILLETFYKISGTASKLGRVESYHHLTLLHSLDLSNLQRFLESPAVGIVSKATKSAPALVKNLVEELPQLTFHEMIQALSQQFLKDGLADPKEYIAVDPMDESQFPGVAENKERLQSWPWIFGKTPKFTLRRDFTGHQFHEHDCTVSIELTVEKGKVAHIGIEEHSKSMGGLVPLALAFYEEHLVGEDLTVKNLTSIKTEFDNFCDKAFVDRSSEVHRGAQWLSDLIQSCLRFV